jgi:pimeloyl-ACP methyl ester carboxylesterase
MRTNAPLPPSPLSHPPFPCPTLSLTHPSHFLPPAGQLSELLFSLQKELGPGPYDLLGTSMGGAIAVNFVNTYPHLSHRLVLVAPAGLPVHIPISAKIIRLPLLGTSIHSHSDTHTHTWSVHLVCHDWTHPSCPPNHGSPLSSSLSFHTFDLLLRLG